MRAARKIAGPKGFFAVTEERDAHPNFKKVLAEAEPRNTMALSSPMPRAAPA